MERNKLDAKKINSEYPVGEIALLLGLRPENDRGNCKKFYCPSHDRDSASLNLYSDTNTWHCFGCKEGHTVIDLVMYIERKTFLEACEYITGQKSSKPRPAPAVTPEATPAFNISMETINQWADDLFYAPEAEPAREYLRSRGIIQADGYSVHAAIAKIGYCDEKITIPYIDYPVKILGVRTRRIDRKDYKSITGSKNSGVCYNNAAFVRNPSKPIWWVESELDIILLSEVLGRTAGIARFHKDAPLRSRRKFIYMLDNDEAGRKEALAIRKRYHLNPFVTIVKPPDEYKDIGDYYVADPVGASEFIRSIDGL